MRATLDLLTLASLVGAFDVLYYHLYRFRLYRRPGSTAEELTHLVRGAVFVGFVAGLMVGPEARPWMVVLLLLDVANTVADVLLERRSRAGMGGLPTGEYLVHVLGSSLVGAAAASFFLAGDRAAPLQGVDVLRAAGTIALGAALWLVESWLFACSLHARSRGEVGPGAGTGLALGA